MHWHVQGADVKPGRFLELGEEAAQCIATNDLSGTDLVAYLRDFLKDVVKEVLAERPKKGSKRAKRKS
jgi:hypothetical protein